MEDFKAMARAKRASSKRGRDRHSQNKHAHAVPAAGAAAGEQNALAEGLPSNWERYSDGGGSADEGSAPPVDGEVRPKSKGADYSQLLSSDAPQLYDDPPESEGMFSIMLDPGLGLWDGDSWLEPPSASQQQSAHDAAALLSLDLGLLERSLSRLHVAERLMVEKELFPKQEVVKQETETSGHPGRSPVSMAQNRLQVDEQDNRANARSSAEIRNHEVTATSPLNNGVSSTEHPVFAADAARSPVYGPLVKSPSLMSGVKGEAPALRNNSVEQASRADERTTFETSAQPPGYRKFMPAAAEADLDELLDMLDSHVSQPPLKSTNLRNGTEMVYSPDLSFLSDQSIRNPQIDSLSIDLNRIPALGSGKHYMAPTVANTDRSEESKASSKENHNISALVLDDDFDSWLDSI